MDITKYFHEEGKYLEIGPLDRPFLTKPQYDVYYMDYNTTENVKKLYQNTYANLEKIVDIDFAVGEKCYKEAVGDILFDGVYSSNCIEHTYDFIGHLVNVADVLKDGGRYIIRFPDMDNRFDFFRMPLSFREAYDVYNGISRLNSFIVDMHMNTCPLWEDDAVNYFHERKASLIPQLFFDEYTIDVAKKIYKSETPTSFFPGCHIWTFTYDSFLLLLRDCLRFNIIPFSLEYYESTSVETNYDIYAVLKKNNEIKENYIKRFKEILNIQHMFEKHRGIRSPMHEMIACEDKRFRHNKSIAYIYGAGEYGKKAFNFLKSVFDCDISFIVSDGEILPLNMPAPVCHLSNIYPNNNIFIFLAVYNLKTIEEIKCNLDSSGFKENIHYIDFHYIDFKESFLL